MARIPLYKAAETEMIRRIRDGEWAPGLRLPNEFGLAEEFGVSQGTMRRALITLEGMGLLARKPGRGTIVKEPMSAPNGAADGTGSAAHGAGFDRLADGGAELALDVFRARTGSRRATASERKRLGTDRLATVERTLKRDGDRYALDEIAVPEALASGLPEDGPVDLAAFLDGIGLTVARLNDHLGADMTTMAESVALSVDRHTPLLVVTRVAQDGAGKVLGQQVLRIVAADIGYSVTLDR